MGIDVMRIGGYAMPDDTHSDGYANDDADHFSDYGR